MEQLTVSGNRKNVGWQVWEGFVGDQTIEDFMARSETDNVEEAVKGYIKDAFGRNPPTIWWTEMNNTFTLEQLLVWCIEDNS